MTRSGEFDWISTYLAPLAADNSFALTDDAALLDVPQGKTVIITQDAIAQGIHFLPEDPPGLVARKALRVNISDVVAKGGVPHSYSMALGVPDHWQDSHMAAFAEGLAADQSQYGIQLTGGDTYRSPDRLCVAITLFGMIDRDAYKSRLAAKPGDLVFVTGTIGNAALGLKVATGQLQVTAEDQAFFLREYQLPNPPLAAAAIIAELANASMDISDGLIGDCRKLCKASTCAAIINRGQIPLSSPVRRVLEADESLWSSILAGGDDYQVLSTVDPANSDEFVDRMKASNIQATHIGEIKASDKSTVALDIDGAEVSIEKDSFSHF